MKLVFLDKNTLDEGDLDFSAIEKYGEVVMYQTTPYNEIADRIADADAVFCNKNLLNADTLIKASKLKYIGIIATGYNNVDLEYTKEHGITVTNAGSYSTDSVAQHTMALMLNHFSRIRDYANFVDAGGWKKSSLFCAMEYTTMETSGKTIGIIGFGSIGQKVAKLALAFGMKVLAYSRTAQNSEKIINEHFSYDMAEGNIRIASLDDIARNSDVVTVHCPLNDSSEKLLNKSFFAKMKQSAYIINTARGGIVNEADLKEALENEIIAGAAIDVLTEEPMQQDSLLFHTKNLTITPHIAWAPHETRQRLLDIVISNYENFLNGTPTNVVN